jgi:hypothetical protein
MSRSQTRAGSVLFAAMRRALVIAGVMFAGLLATAPTVASAAGAPIREAKFELHEDGFLVAVKSEIAEEKITLTFARHGEVAVYQVAAEFTADTVKARFGQLGELDYTFTPGSRPGVCGGFVEGVFEGTFTFAGENEFVTFEAPRARGTFAAAGTQGCKESHRAKPTVRAPGSEAKPEPAKDEATLIAHTTHARPLRSMLVFEGEGRHARLVFFSAFEYERTEGMLIARGAQTAGPRRDFTWDLGAGTARIDPPAPFTGSATLTPRPGGAPIWRGSLRAPMPGGRPFRLSGADFQAQLVGGSPLD